MSLAPDTPLLLDPAVAETLAGLETVEGIFARASTLEVMTAAIDAVVVGRAAARLLGDGRAALPALGGLWIAPTWAWYRGADLFDQVTTQRLQPRRLAWDGGPLVLLGASRTSRPGGSATEVAWSEPGTSMRAGSTRVALGVVPRPRRAGSGPHAVAGTGPRHPAPALGVPTEVVVGSRTRGQLEEVLEALATRGHETGWRFLMWLERFVDRELPRANVAVGMEIREHLAAAGTAALLRPGTGAVDETTLETVRHRLMFGEGDRPGRIQSLVERAYAETTFAAVDPISWLRRAIARDCNQMVRSAVGDPRQGRRIRAAHALGHGAEAISAQIGVTPATVEKALNPGGDAAARAVSIGHYDRDGEPLADFGERAAAEEPTPHEIVEAGDRVREVLALLEQAIAHRERHHPRTGTDPGTTPPAHASVTDALGRTLDRSLGGSWGGSWQEGAAQAANRDGIEGYREVAERLRHVLEAGGSAPVLYLRSLGIGQPRPE